MESLVDQVRMAEADIEAGTRAAAEDNPDAALLFLSAIARALLVIAGKDLR